MRYVAQGSTPGDQSAIEASAADEPGSTPTLVVVWGHDGPVSVQLIEERAAPRAGASLCPRCHAPMFTTWTKKFF